MIIWNEFSVLDRCYYYYTQGRSNEADKAKMYLTNVLKPKHINKVMGSELKNETIVSKLHV